MAHSSRTARRRQRLKPHGAGRLTVRILSGVRRVFRPLSSSKPVEVHLTFLHSAAPTEVQARHWVHT